MWGLADSQKDGGPHALSACLLPGWGTTLQLSVEVCGTDPAQHCSVGLGTCAWAVLPTAMTLIALATVNKLWLLWLSR